MVADAAALAAAGAFDAVILLECLDDFGQPVAALAGCGPRWPRRGRGPSSTSGSATVRRTG